MPFTFKPILYHDGCEVCLSIVERFTSIPGMNIEVVNLSVDKHRIREAMYFGTTRLPSLVIGDQVMRLDDHSPIASCL